MKDYRSLKALCMELMLFGVCVWGGFELAAVAYEVNSPLSFEDVHVAPPGPTEVRIQVTHASVCQSDLYYLKGKVILLLQDTVQV